MTTPARGRFGHHYKPGKLAERDLAAWQHAGEMLFGPGGALEPYRCRPIFSNSGIGPYGCLVLAVVERCGPVTGKEVESILASYMDVKSVRRHLGYIKGHELVRLKGDKYFVTRGLSKKIEAVELEFGAAVKNLKVDNERDKKWINYQTEILGKPELDLLKSTLRKLSCFYCEAVPPPTGGEVEHFPPIHWGGSDETSLLLPICKRCNKIHGNRIRGSKPEKLTALAFVLTIKFPGTPEETVQYFMNQMLSNSLLYATAMNEMRIDDAKAAAWSAYAMWAAIKGSCEGVRFVDTRTGEIDEGSPREPLIEFHDSLKDFQGIPDMLAPLKRKSD